MILDTSAIVAIIFQEPGYEEVFSKLGNSQFLGIGVPTVVETAIVLSARMRRDSRALLSRFLQEASVEQIPFGDLHASTAADAWLRFGKGRHRAALNFGDCLCYAVAKLSGLPLLCTGNDFQKTDLVIA